MTATDYRTAPAQQLRVKTGQPPHPCETPLGGALAAFLGGV
jgi:hypothetical protein